MSWVVIAIVLFAIYLAIRAVGLVSRLLLWTLVIAALYWLAARFFGLPMPF